MGHPACEIITDSPGVASIVVIACDAVCSAALEFSTASYLRFSLISHWLDMRKALAYKSQTSYTLFIELLILISLVHT